MSRSIRDFLAVDTPSTKQDPQSFLLDYNSFFGDTTVRKAPRMGAPDEKGLGNRPEAFSVPEEPIPTARALLMNLESILSPCKKRTGKLGRLLSMPGTTNHKARLVAASIEILLPKFPIITQLY